MLFTDVQRSVRLNKKKKSTNTSPYPDEVIDRLARAFYPAILACWNSEEGQREFAAWQAEQAHHANNEKQEVPTGELPAVHLVLVCGFWQGASGWAHPVFVLPYFTLRCRSFCTAHRLRWISAKRPDTIPKAAYITGAIRSSSFFSVPARWRSANTTVTVSLMKKLHQMP